MNVKIFFSKYAEGDKQFWIPVVQQLFQKGYKVYQEVEECDHAIILSGAMENPSAFENKTLFYVSKMPHQVDGKITFNVWQNFLKMKFHVPILMEYYDTAFDMALKPSNQIVDEVINYINELNKPGS